MKGAALPAPTAPSEPFSAVKLFRWTWEVIRLELFWFWISALGGLLLVLGNLYQSQIMSSVVAQLAFSRGSQGEAAAEPTGKTASAVLGALIPQQLLPAVALMVATIVFLKLFDYAIRAIDELLNSRMLERLQLTLHDKLLQLGPEWHDRRDAGNSTMLVNSLAPGVRSTLSQVAQYPIVEGVGLVGALALIYSNLGNLPDIPVSVRIGVVVALLAIPLVSRWLSNRAREAYQDALLAEGGISTEILNSLSQPTDMLALGAAGQRSKRMAQRLHEATKARLRRGLRSDILTSFITALPDLLQGLFLAYGVLVTIQNPNPAAVTAILAVYQIIPKAISPLSALIGFYSGLNAQWPDVLALGRVLDAKAAIKDGPDAGTWPEGEVALAMRGLVFSYEGGDRHVLDGVDHRFAPGRITAIVGQSGSGKSTILQLILRLREPMSGAIEIGGRPISSIKLDELRRHVVVVSQVSPFLTDTVRENFLLAAAEASDSDIEAVCRRTGFWDVLMRRNAAAPLDQVMTREQGKDFSGGERRLLAVTRALLRRPAILLLDEPTTGVDMLHIEQLRNALRAAAQGTTVLMIEHNLDFVRGLADEVCVIDNGRFVEVGPPRQLEEQPGLFHELLEARRRMVASVEGMTVEAHPMPQLDAAASPPETPKVAIGARKKAFAP